MRKLFFVATASLFLAACGSQPPAPEQSGAGVEDRTPSAVKVETPPVTQVTPEKLDLTSLAALRDPKSILSKRSVFFDYDQYTIKNEFKPLLEAHGRFLAANAKIKMLIQGNADERGSREYNLSLGQRRSVAVKKSLNLLGVQDGQIETVSFGEEKATAGCADESCAKQNRRADIVYENE